MWWLNNVWDCVVPTVSDLCQNPKKVLVPYPPQSVRPKISWVPPSAGTIKINVDGLSWRNLIGVEYEESFGITRVTPFFILARKFVRIKPF